MKLRTALQAGAIFPIALAIIICVTLILRWLTMDNLARILERSQDLTAAVSELDFAFQQWVRTGKPEAEATWRKNRDKTESILLKIASPEPLVQVRVRSMLDTCRQSGDTFTELSGGKIDRYPIDRTALSVPQQRLLDELSGQIRTMMSDTAQIGSASQSGALAEEQDMDLMITIWLSILALAMAGCMLFAGRRIMRRFDVVSNGIGAIADGRTDHKLEIQGTDELDELLHSFNKMSQQLGKSQEVLRKEAAEHQSAAEALRKANIILSDALVKLKRAQTQAIDSARLGALSQVVHGMEHSFNNTLTPILGLSDFLLAYPDSLNDHKALTDHLKTISGAVRKAREQIDRMVEFFRPAKDLQSTPVNINELVQQTVRATRRIWMDAPKDKGLVVQLNTVPGELPIMEADQAGLCEAITNLIVNSVEAMPRGGTIEISTRREQDYLVLRVLDNGEGMTEEVRSRCLEPFFSTKGSGSAGMGLTVVAGTVKRHGGTLGIESSPGSGTTVTIKLPIRAGSQVPESHGTHDSQRSKAIRILLADDEPWVLHLCGTSLKAEGHEVVTTADGTEALSKFRAGRFDMVILDQAMPSMTGDELARVIRKEAPGTKVVLLTGFADVLMKNGALPESVDAILSKPVSVEALNDAVTKLMTGKRPEEA